MRTRTMRCFHADLVAGSFQSHLVVMMFRILALLTKLTLALPSSVVSAQTLHNVQNVIATPD
jgi:hypothetical protein